MTLPMAPRVYQTFVVDIVRSTLTCEYDMIRFYVFSWYKRDGTQGASVPLSLVQHQPLFRKGFPSHLLFLSLRPILAQGRVIGRVSSYDLREAGDRGCVGFDQFCLPFPECPVAIVPKIAGFHPCTAFVRVSAFCPNPEHAPLDMPYFTEDVFGHRVSVIIRPSPYNGIEFFDYFPRRGLLMCVQVGSYRPHMLEDFFLLWDGQQFFLPAPEFPDMESQEVKPFSDMYDPGFSFVQCQPSLLEKLSHAWSGVGFQYFPCRGRYHKVIGVPNDGYTFVGSFAMGWGFGSSIWPFGLKQPFHAIQCHICQQWGNDSPLWRARVRGREEADFDHSCFQPAAQCGGEYWQFGQQRAMVNIVKGSNNFIPLSTTHW